MSKNQSRRRREGLSRSPWLREQESRTCRRCGVAPGQQCVSSVGTFLTRPHMERFYDAGGTPERDQQRTYHEKVRREERRRVFAHYGTSCACCGATEDLAIDHIDGRGHQRRKETGTGERFYRWLIKNDFPGGFQVLCLPCNTSKGRGERCQMRHDDRHICPTCHQPLRSRRAIRAQVKAAPRRREAAA